MPRAREIHRRRGRPHVVRGVVNLCGAQRAAIGPDTAGDEHAAIGQQRRTVVRPRPLHRRRLQEATDGRTVPLRRRAHPALGLATGHEDAAVIQQHRRCAGAAMRHVTGWRPRVGRHVWRRRLDEERRGGCEDRNNRCKNDRTLHGLLLNTRVMDYRLRPFKAAPACCFAVRV